MELMPGFLEGTVKLIELHKSERWRGDAFVIRSELTLCSIALTRISAI